MKNQSKLKSEKEMNRQKDIKDEDITEKELKIIEEIAREKGITQRELSKRAGISLGMVNISLKRLARKGYIKVKGMNKRSLEYVLTPKGFSEKAKRSYRYFLNTLSSLKKMKKKIQSLVLEEYAKGRKNFIILGGEELADLVEMSLKALNFKDINYKRKNKKDEIKKEEKDWIILSTEKGYRDNKEKENFIDLVEKLTE